MKVEERVARGAALLDEHDPDWFNWIDLDTLDIKNPRYCVLGQWGKERRGYIALSFTRSIDELQPDDAGNADTYGFALNSDETGKDLNNAWRQAILERRRNA